MKTEGENAVSALLTRARDDTARGDDEAAKQAYLDILRLEPTHRSALLELGLIALTTGHREAARTVLLQAAQCHPDDLTSRVTLGNMALEDGAWDAAQGHFQDALGRDPDCAPAHQGLARVLSATGREAEAGPHWARGFAGHAIAAREYRGAGGGMDVLLLAAVRGGNVRLRPWMNDRILAVTVIYPEYYDLTQALPRHSLIVNAIGDADLCAEALVKAERLTACSPAPVINRPERVLATGRAGMGRLGAGIEGLVVPQVRLARRDDILAGKHLPFPFLLRTPGLHTGQHFVLVESRASLAGMIAQLPGDELFMIEYFAVRAADGMVRKYRVMFIEGQVYPWHLAISPDWKVHYFTAAMQANAAFREEERRFLDDMPGVLGARAMTALQALCGNLALDFAGADFALSPDGSVLLFETNATMAINAPPEGALWNYRRAATGAVQRATQQVLLRRPGVV